jgi:hypothetical protein
MKRLWGPAAFVLLALAMPARAEEQPPVTIAPGNVTGEPRISTRDFQGHQAWSMIWARDAEGRELLVGYIEGLQMPYRERRTEMLKFAHDESSEDEADLRPQIDGRSEAIWGLDVYWLAASERAVMAPDRTKPETMKDGKLHRGDARRNCVVFTAYPPKPTATLVGAYCRDLAADVTVSEATFRQWLEALDLKLRQ